MNQERGDTQLKKYWNMGLGSGQSTLIGSRSQINISEGIFGMANVCRQRMARGGPLVQSHSQSRAVLKGKSGCKRPSRSSVTVHNGDKQSNRLTGVEQECFSLGTPSYIMFLREVSVSSVGQLRNFISMFLLYFKLCNSGSQKKVRYFEEHTQERFLLVY